MPRPNYTSRLVQRAQEAFRRGNFDELERRCEQILKAEPRNPDATRLLGQIKLQRGDHQKALRLLEIAASVTPPASPAMADVLLSLGKAQLYAGRHDEAIKNYDKAVELAPKLFTTWYNRGNALVDVGRHEEAIASYRRALALDPKHIEANYNLGHALIKINRDMAIAAFERVLALDPAHSDARFARCMSEIRVIYDDEAEITNCRAAYSAQLNNLTANTEGLETPTLPPFYLAYQGRNDRELQGRLGNLICRLMAKFNP